jgi:hypothetical protein
MANDKLVFNSKIDTWLLLVILGAAATCFAVGAQYWDFVSGAYWWVGVLLLLSGLFPLWFLFTTRYAMSDAELLIHSGPLSWIVPIAEITKLEPSNNAISNPALSLDRLEIRYGQGRSIMISPEPRKAFVQQLEYRRRQLSTAATD